MSQDSQSEQVATKTVVYRLPGMTGVPVRRDVAYRMTNTGPLTLDIYYPSDFKSGARRPAVIIVAGYPDPGFQRVVGCKFKELGATVSWAQLIAASGLAAITYTNCEPAADLHALLAQVRQEAIGLELAGDRMGLWASSGNVPLALSALMQTGHDSIRCAVLCAGYMLDLDGANGVAEAARQFGFANPTVGKSVADLPPGLPLFIARAGQDEMPHLNETLDRFVAQALTHNLPLTLVNHPKAPHAFDLFYDCEVTREIVRQILAFMQCQLLTRPTDNST